MTGNVHTSMFTRIPRRITKDWSPKLISLATKSPIDRPSANHEESLISKVSLIVEYNPSALISQYQFTEDDEQSTDQADAWNEARKDWEEIEASIERVLARFAERTISRSNERKIMTGEVLAKKKTMYEVSRFEDTPNDPVIIPQYERTQTRQSGVSTIAPSDSASIRPRPRQARGRTAPIRAMSFLDYVRT